ncbi:hypothetical protein OOT08_19045, partial [Leucobacter sp. M11]
YLVLNRSVSPQLRKNADYAALLEQIAGFMRRGKILFPATRSDAAALAALQQELNDMSPVIADLVIAAHHEEVRLRD